MDYSDYGLKRNPFPIHGSFPIDDDDEEVYALLMTGREDVKGELDRLLKNLREGEPSSLILILGEYGTGKTHCLKYLEYKSRKKYDNIVPVYLKGIPGPGVKYLLRAFLESLERSLGRDFLVNLARNPPRRASPDVKSFFVAMASGKEIAAIRWAKGYELSPQERKELKISSDLDEHVALDLFSAIIKAMQSLKLKALILVDEVEELLRYGKGELLNFYSGLRHLVDSVPRGMVTVLSATPALTSDEEKGIAALNPALMSRMRARGLIITLKPLNVGDLKVMLTSYLRAFRTPESRGLTTSYPFEEEALDLIAQASGGIPRRALVMASSVLREALSRRKRVIDVAFVEEVLGVERPVEEERHEVKTAERDVDVVKVKVLKVLREEGGSVTFSKLIRKVRVKKDELMRKLREMEGEGLIRVNKVKRGYRVVLVEEGPTG